MKTQSELHQKAEAHFLHGLQHMGDLPYGPQLDPTDLEHAMEQFQAAISTNPRFGLAHVYLGITRALQNHRQQAENSFHAALELIPHCYLAHTYRAWTRSDSTSAMADFKRAIRNAPDHWLPHYEQARYHQSLEQHDSAIESFTKSVYRDAPTPAYFRRGLSYMKKHKYPAAIDDFTETLERDPTWHEAHVRRAECRIIMGESETAIQDYDAAIANLPPESVHYRYRGYAKIRRGDYEAAISDIRFAISLEEGECAQSHHFLAIAQHKSGNLPEALHAINEALALAPNNPTHYYLRARIKDAMNDDAQPNAPLDSRLASLINATAPDRWL